MVWLYYLVFIIYVDIIGIIRRPSIILLLFRFVPHEIHIVLLHLLFHLHVLSDLSLNLPLLHWFTVEGESLEYLVQCFIHLLSRTLHLIVLFEQLPPR